MAVVINVVGKYDDRDIAKARKSLAGLGSTAETTATRSKRSFSSMAGDVRTWAGAVAGLAIVKFGSDSVHAFGEAEAAQEALNLTFEKFPLLANSSADALRELNAETQRKTRFDDDALAVADATLARFKLTGQEIERLTPLLADYASATKQDVTTAAEGLGKALLGNARALKAVGIDFKSTGDRSADVTRLMELLRQQVGGFAEKEGQTAEGTLARMNLQFGEVKETIGQSLMPAIRLGADGLTSLAEGAAAVPVPLRTAALAMVAASLAGKLLGERLDPLRSTGSRIATEFRSIGDTWRYVGTQAAMAGVQYESTGKKIRAMATHMRVGQQATNLLKGAGSGLLSMLGGPWGIAIGGATLAVTAYMNAQQNADEAVQGLTSTLDKQSGALTAETMQKIADALKEDVNLDDWQRVPFTMKDVISAVAAGGPALDKLKGSLDAYIDTMGRASGDEAARAQQAAMGIRSSIENQVEVVGDARLAWEANKAAVEAAGEAQKTIVPPITGLTTKADAQKQAIDKLKNSWSEFTGLLDKRAAKREWLDSMAEIEAKVKAAGGRFDESTGKGRAFQDWLDGTVGNLKTYAAGFKDPLQQQRVMNEGLDKIKANLAKQGLSPAQVTKIMSGFDQIKSKVVDLQEQAAKAVTLNIKPQITGNGTIVISAPGGGRQLLDVGYRAAGGPVTRGKPYVVGERQAELFVPNESGTILPSVPTGSAGRDVTLNVHPGAVVIQGNAAAADVDAAFDRFADRIIRELTAS